MSARNPLPPSRPHSKVPQIQAPKAQTPHVERGDHLYVNHPQRGPIAAQVRGVGKDGVTVRCDQGKHHQVRWSAVLGHKARVAQTYQVEEQGADGAIVSDDKGRRRYIEGDTTEEPEARAPAPEKPRDPLTEGLNRLAKCLGELRSLTARPLASSGRYLLLKATAAAQVAGRPGLTLQDMTDSKGRRTRHWVRSAPKKSALIHDERQVDVEHVAGEARQPENPSFRGTSDPKPDAAPRKPKEPATGVIKDRRQADLLGGGGDAPAPKKRQAATMKHGQSVRFQHGQVEGEGKIVASGKDGVTVEDAEGRLHQVRHEALLGPGKGAKAN